MNQEIVQPKKKKWYKKKWPYIIAVIVFVIFVIAFSQYNKANQPVEYETVKVERGNLVQTVDATGNIESADELDLRFETNGRVGRIYKKTNDQVKAGDVIVDLQLGELNARLAQANASVAKAKANLDKELAGQTTEYLANLEAKLDQAKANLDQIKAQKDDSISDAIAAFRTAENNLELSDGGEDSQIVKDAYDDMVALLQSVQNVLANALIESDNVLGIDNTLANDDFKDELSVLNSSKLNQANTKYHAAKATKIDFDESMAAISTASSHTDIDWAADTAEEGLVVMKDLLFAVSGALDATIPVGDLSQSELDVLKTGIQTERATVSTKYASLVDQIQAISTAQNSYVTNQIAYDKALADLENITKQGEADVLAYQSLVDQAQASLNDAENPPREVDIAGLRAALREAQASVAQAVANRNKARIIAPVDGVIGKIDAKIGEYISSADAVVKLISPHFEVKVDIPETDIVKIALDDFAEITLDAYGEDVVFMGNVTEIEQGETIIQDVVYYSVTVSLEDSEEYQVLNGMTANIIFSTDEKQDILFIPQRAVKTGDDGKFVRILENEEAKEMPVKIGLRGDSGLVEILEGVSEGQDIVLKIID
jgi:HlyD family secretion protein